MKIYIFSMSLILLLIAEGSGAALKRMLGIDRQGFNAPIGFAFLLSLCQLLYYPAQLFGFSFRYICIVTGLVLIAGVVFVIYDIQDIRRSLFRRETLIVLVMGLLFAVLCREHNVLSIEGDAAQFSDRVWELNVPRFQGYYYAALAFSRFINMPLALFGSLSVTQAAAQIYGMGLLFVMISSMLIVDIVRRMNLRNHWFEFALGIYLLMNGNYSAWSPGTAWLGLSWSVFFTGLAVYTGYRYLNEGNEMIKYLWLPVLGAGLACNNSFGLSGIAILYGYMVYLFSVRKIRCLFDLFTFLIPYVLYIAAVSANRWWTPLSWILVLCYAWFLFFRYRRPIRRWITRSEEYFFDNYKKICLILVPCVLAALSLLIGVLHGWSGIISYAYYFSDFTEIDGMRDYLFIHSDILQFALNLFRWGGLITLLLMAKKPSDQGVRIMLGVIMLVFLNPLCTPALVYMTGPMFYHTFNVLFNPFTEAILFLFIYQMFQWTVIGQWVLEIMLCLGALIGASGIL